MCPPHEHESLIGIIFSLRLLPQVYPELTLFLSCPQAIVAGMERTIIIKKRFLMILFMTGLF
jgi:hypothetical protein